MAREGVLEHAVDEDGSEKLGRWPLKSNIGRYVKFLKSKKSASAETQVTLDELQRRALQAKVERAELILEAQRGSMHPSRLVIDLYSDRVRACRETALAIPNKIAQMIADETDVAKVFKILNHEMEEVLTRLSAPTSEEVMGDASRYIIDPDAEDNDQGR